MKAEASAHAASVSQALTKGACPICGKEFEAFHEQLKQGVHAGGGLLGRVAEFLVGQRGL